VNARLEVKDEEDHEEIQSNNNAFHSSLQVLCRHPCSSLKSCEMSSEGTKLDNVPRAFKFLDVSPVYSA